MGRYKTEKIFYPNRWQLTENLVADGYYYASTKPSETIEIAAHIMDAAHKNGDDELFEVGRDLMRVANSPCSFQADYSAKNATDINNRPSENIIPVIPDDLLSVDDDDEEEWDNQYDGVFDPNIDPQKVFKKLELLDDPRVTEDYPRFFVFFKVLVYLGWIENHQKNFLNWANCHWNCNWKYSHNFKFGNNIKKELRDTHMSKWNGNTLPKSDVGNAYRAFAIDVLSVLTETVNGGKIIDRIAFYRGGVTERINDGKNLDYPF